MPNENRQKYHITIGYQNGQSVQAITFMDRKAFREALAAELDEFGFIHLDCRSGIDEHIDLDIITDNIQLVLHQKFIPVPQPGQSPILVPNLRAMQ